MSGPPAPSVERLLVWRHGRTRWNAEGRFQGQLDPPLDPTGIAQAARSAARLAEQLPAGRTLVVTSDLQRARATAEALAPLVGAQLQIEPRLREHGLGSWEGLTRAEVVERYPAQYDDWRSGGPVHERGGESADAVGQRALAAVRDLPPAEAAVLVTHGGTSGRLLEALLGLGPAHRRLFGPLGNCAWTELVHSPSGWRVLRHNVAVEPVPVAADGGGALLRAGATPDEAPQPTDADAVA